MISVRSKVTVIDAFKNLTEESATDNLCVGTGIWKRIPVKCSPIQDVTETATTSEVVKIASLNVINLVIFNPFYLTVSVARLVCLRKN